MFAKQTQHGSIQLLVLLMWADGTLCLPLPVFVVETTEVIELGDFFEVLRQFIQLPVFLSVQVGLHEWSYLITHRKQSCIITEMIKEEKKIITMMRSTLSPFCGFIRKFRPMSSNIMVFLLL